MAGVPWGTSENFDPVVASSGKKASGARAAQSSVPGIIYGGGPIEDSYVPKKSPYMPDQNGCPFATSNEQGSAMPAQGPYDANEGISDRLRTVQARKQVGAAKVGASTASEEEHRANFFAARDRSNAAKSRNRGSGNLLSMAPDE